MDKTRTSVEPTADHRGLLAVEAGVFRKALCSRLGLEEQSLQMSSQKSGTCLSSIGD
jgi:hypothetical protein